MRTPSITRDQIRELDRIAIQEYGIPGVCLMENAGRACSDVAEEMLEDVTGRRVTVIAGTGNNGGDGCVVARHLFNGKALVEIHLTAPPEKILAETGDAATNLEVALNMGIPVSVIEDSETIPEAMERIRRADLVVDAILGTGITGEVREPVKTLINELNKLGRRILAVDIPSGLDCDLGVPLGVAVKAEVTVSFVLRKRCFDAPGARVYSGDVRVAGISVPRTLIEQKLLEWGVVNEEE